MNPSTLIPAYGRDYKSKKTVIEDFMAGKDFIIADISNRWDGKPCNKEDIEPGQIKIRYSKLTKVCVFNYERNER